MTQLLTIGGLARASGLSVKALRLYDETGLLPPAEVDPWSGYRRYHPHQLGRARLVARLRLAGMPLTRIRVVADAADARDHAAAAAELTSYARQVAADAASAQALLGTLVAELTGPPVGEEDTMTTTIPPEMPTAALAGGRGGRDTQLDVGLAGPVLYAVADGFGEAAGFAPDLLDHLAGRLGPGDGLEDLDRAVATAAAEVAELHAASPGVGCTLTAALLDGSRVQIAHLGDSRAYRVRRRRVERLTRDHTVTQTLVDEGRLTAEEAAADDRRVQLNRAVAVEVADAAPDLISQRTEPGDRYVLATDGVHGVLAPDVLTELLTAPGTPDEVATAVAAAVEAAGAPDNHHVLVVDLP